MAIINMSAPWMTLYHKMTAMFGKDKEIKVIYDDEEKTITLYVDNSAKASALNEILPIQKTFGTVTVKINVVPSNRSVRGNKGASVYEAAFDGNPVVSYIKDLGVDNLFEFTYVVFQKEVVQFFNDQLDDINGLYSTLYQDIARELFVADPDVCFCTDNKMYSLTAVTVPCNSCTDNTQWASSF